MKVQTSLCQQLVKSVWEAINVSEINLVNVYLETELLELIHMKFWFDTRTKYYTKELNRVLFTSVKIVCVVCDINIWNGVH